MKYAVLWLFVSVLMVVVALAPGSVVVLSKLVGFELASNFLFFCGFGLLLAVTLQISMEMTKVEAQVQRLAEEVAILTEEKERGSAGDPGPVDGEDA